MSQTTIDDMGEVRAKEIYAGDAEKAAGFLQVGESLPAWDNLPAHIQHQYCELALRDLAAEELAREWGNR